MPRTALDVNPVVPTTPGIYIVWTERRAWLPSYGQDVYARWSALTEPMYRKAEAHVASPSAMHGSRIVVVF
jgi:hypothetical protein